MAFRQVGVIVDVVDLLRLMLMLLLLLLLNLQLELLLWRVVVRESGRMLKEPRRLNLPLLVLQQLLKCTVRREAAHIHCWTLKWSMPGHTTERWRDTIQSSVRRR